MILPYQEVLIWSAGLAFVSALLYRLLSDHKEVRRLKKLAAEYQKKSNDAQKSGDSEGMKKNMNEMLKIQKSMFSQNTKPMLAGFVVFAIFLYVFATGYKDIAVLSPFTIPFIGKDLGWFWWYFASILGFNFFFRKMLALD
jgi:uncharacterized membrane protein (DUF106 family)